MKRNEEMHHLVRDNDMSEIVPKVIRTIQPRLRKNKRLERRWGEKYYIAVKKAVFMLPTTPHIAPETPLMLREESDECQDLYPCKQCNDCFRFPSSLEAHNSRRSWILGYWCRNCFLVTCSHTPKGQPPCFDCNGINRQRTMFLRAKGLKKGRKMGFIKIFYNQCQFFAHLRQHDTTVVDMADVMLMPVPLDVDRESYATLERLCETIMEHMFLTRTHIMDWLKSHQLGNKWWRLLQSSTEDNKNPLAEILAANGKTFLGRSAKNSGRPQKVISMGSASPGSSSVSHSPNYDTPSSISRTIESVIAQSNYEEMDPLSRGKHPAMPPLRSIARMNPLESVEHEDNPCTTTDIAFVDCGPAAKTYPPDVAIVLPSNDKLTIISNGSTNRDSVGNNVPVKSEPHSSSKISENPLSLKQRPANKVGHTTSSSNSSSGGNRAFEPKISVKKFANERLKTAVNISHRKTNPRMNREAPQAARKLTPVPCVRLPAGKRSLPSVMEITRAVETSKKVSSQASLSTLGSKILTVHSPKNTELSKIISQLPPEVINGKKIVFIGHDSAERFTILPKNDTSSSSTGMIKIQSETEKSKVIQTFPTKILPKIAPRIKSNIESKRNAKTVSETTKTDLSDKVDLKIQQSHIDGKVIYQNGKKFIIRQARKAIQEATVCTNINSLKLQTIPRHVSLSSFLSNPPLPVNYSRPIAPKPANTGANKALSPPTLAPLSSSSSSPPSLSLIPSLSSSLSTSEDPIGLKQNAPLKRNRSVSEGAEISVEFMKTSESQTLISTPLSTLPIHNAHALDTVERFSIKINTDGKLYVDFSGLRKADIVWTQNAQNYMQQMYENFRHRSGERIEQLIDHLKEINTEFSKMLDVIDDERISDNLKAIEQLESGLKRKPTTSSDKDQVIDQLSSVEDVNKIISTLKETRERPPVCPTCNRATNPEPQILEFSKGSVESLSCTSCNIYVCHICNIYQGNISRFRAHLNFHTKKEPFACPECFRKFPTFRRLETHMWTTCFHLLTRKWFMCKICLVEGFLNMESVTKHFILAHSKLTIACPECGMLMKSETDFENHTEENHPTVINRLEPVNLMVCDVGQCVIRLENFRSHMDHHVAVVNVTYYKCPFCFYLVRSIKRGRDQIRSHLYEKHSEKLPELGSPENLNLECFKQLCPSKDYKSQSDHNSDLCSDTDSQGIEVIESEQASDVSESMQKNAAAIVSDNITRNTQKNNKSSSNCQSGVIDTPTNVITEYSSSPKIFDVRSVTPDSYAEFGGGTREIEIIATGTEKKSKSVSDISKESVSEDSYLIKLGDQSLAMTLPQVIVVNQEASTNLTEMLQSTLAAPNTFVKLSDLTNSDGKIVAANTLELGIALTDKNTDVPQTKESSEPVIKNVFTTARSPEPERCKEIINNSTTVDKLPELVEIRPSSKKQMLPMSILKSNNSSVQNVSIDAAQQDTQASDSNFKVFNQSQIVPNNRENYVEATEDPLHCSLPKPPPLSRIPSHLLELSQDKTEVGEEKIEEIKVTTSECVAKTLRRQKRPWRIALNAPIHTSELINYRCHLCGELINTSWSVLKNHFRSRHSRSYKLAIVTPRLLRMSSDFIAEGYKEVVVSKKRKSDGSVPISKRRRRWNPRKHIEIPSLGPGLCVRQESLQDKEGNFICKKCDEQCNDISSLRTHIGTNHRIKDHYLVCLECGENFVVEPSLQMHLKAFHQIKDPSAYMAENTAYAKDIIESIEEESNTGIANQCHVCMAVFEDKLAVDKHLRVHGMAFLNRKRIEARIAARNPEKKCKIDKPDDSLITAAQKNEKLENHKLDKIESVNETVMGR